MADMCSRLKWLICVDYDWYHYSDKKLSEYGKAARAAQNQFHRSGSNSYANQQADYEDEHGKKMSLLALWIKSHSGKDGTFLPGTVTEDFVDDAQAKIEMLKTIDPTKPEQELGNAAFEDTMHGGQIPVRPVGYGLGVQKSDVYGVHGVLRKQGYGKVRERTVVMESVKEDVSALSKKNVTLEKENGKLQAQVNQLVGQVRTGTTSINRISTFSTRSLVHVTQ
ncbi:uncharacterized protein [Spinacia oleracea]|uniref:Uncharacterized protein isoform X2 n=1 Tax=Spinacia oleracea TaxID=3562 RepID=A0ABM3RML7_SPIOL|nr:uncharacterized protein LOC110792694 isoform X2 [Spinacia oleracea]